MSSLSRLHRRARHIRKLLDELIPCPEIPLQHDSPFTLLVAVILSARSQDARVNKVTPALFQLAKTAAQFALLDPSSIQPIIKPCGLSPQKAKNIVAMSKMLVELHGGKVPKDLDALTALPGVGHKTASVVLVQAFGIPAFPVDTHIYRSARRWGLSIKKTIAGVEGDLKALFPPSSWGKIHLQIIHYARKYCPARAHQIHSCPICSFIASERKSKRVEAVTE